MGYYNPVYRYGVSRFLSEAKNIGVDGLIIVDCPAETDDEICIPAVEAGISFIRLVPPTADDERLPKVLENTTGFVYYVSVTGITGSASPDFHEVQQNVSRLRKHTDLPIVVGFGVKTGKHAATLAKFADGVVVGTAIVSAIAESLDTEDRATPKTLPAVTSLVDELSMGVKSVFKNHPSDNTNE